MYYFILSLMFLNFPIHAQEIVSKEIVEQWPSLGKMLAYVVGFQFVLYGLAEGLTRIAVLTESKFDNKIAAILSQAVWVLGSFLGKFGYSVPKKVIEAKAKEENEKTS